LKHPSAINFEKEANIFSNASPATSKENSGPKTEEILALSPIPPQIESPTPAIYSLMPQTKIFSDPSELKVMPKQLIQMLRRNTNKKLRAMDS